MDLKDRFIKMPLVGSLGKRLVNKWRTNLDRKTISKLDKISHPMAKILKKVLNDLKERNLQSDRKWVERIEAERKQLLKRNTPLVDGSFDDEGLYDGEKTISEACLVSRDLNSAKFLYFITKSLKPKNTIELGTNVGISSAYIAAALYDIENEGQLVTMDASPYRQKNAKEIHQNLGLNNIEYVQGLFYETLEDTLNRMGRVDLAFIDGHHQYKPTLDYLDEIYPRTVPGAVFLFDDIRYSDGMKKAWKEIEKDSRFDFVVDLKNIGLCVRGKNESSERYVIPTIHNAIVRS